MDQICEELEEIIIDCGRNSGGITEVLAGDLASITSKTVDETTWKVTDLTSNTAPVDIAIKRKTSNYTEDEQNDFNNGSVVVTATVNLMIHRRGAAKSRALNILGAGQRYLYVIVKDLNGKYWYFEYMQLQSTGEGSGQERADGSKYSVVMVGEDDHLAYEIDEAVVAALKAVS